MRRRARVSLTHGLRRTKRTRGNRTGFTAGQNLPVDEAPDEMPQTTVAVQGKDLPVDEVPDEIPQAKVAMQGTRLPVDEVPNEMPRMAPNVSALRVHVIASLCILSS